MIINLINEVKKYESFRCDISSFFPDSLDKLRIQAQARKALREGNSTSIIIDQLLSDSYFQKITNKLSRDKCLKVVSEIVTIAQNQESKLSLKTSSK